MKKVIIVDCSALAYSAFYAYGHLSYDGTETGVIFGLLSKLKNIGDMFNCPNFILCWDSKREDFHRNKDYRGYKQSRQKVKTREEAKAKRSFYKQLGESEQRVIPAIGFKNSFKITGFEADDLLAVFARRMHSKGYKVIVATNDCDMYQILDCCDILLISSKDKNKLFTEKDLQQQYGIKANQWAMAKAIGGCVSDSVVGIRGVADPKKTSSKALLYLNGKLPQGRIYDRIESVTGNKIILKNLPIVTTPYKEELLPVLILRRDKFTLRKFINIFEQYGFYSFLKNEQMEKWKRVFLNPETKT